jgi:hypothetical protein
VNVILQFSTLESGPSITNHLRWRWHPSGLQLVFEVRSLAFVNLVDVSKSKGLKDPMTMGTFLNSEWVLKLFA